MFALLTRYRRQLLLAAAALTIAAVFLPLWGMTLVSTQYPDGLRIMVYARHITGDIAELNALNHYIGMIPISDAVFPELKLLPLGFAVAGAACVAANFLRRRWAAALPLGLMLALATYGFWIMQRRLYQFGHELDPDRSVHTADDRSEPDRTVRDLCLLRLGHDPPHHRGSLGGAGAGE